MTGVVCTPLFHCPRCKDHWIEFGTVPENCPFKRQPTRGPAINLARSRKRRVGYRKRKRKRSLGFVDKIFGLLELAFIVHDLEKFSYWPLTSHVTYFHVSRCT